MRLFNLLKKNTIMPIKYKIEVKTKNNENAKYFCITKPLKAIKKDITCNNYKLNETYEEVLLEQGTLVEVVTGWYECRLNEDIQEIRALDKYNSNHIFNDFGMLFDDDYKTVYVNRNELNRYSFPYSKKIVVTISNLTEHIEIDFEKILKGYVSYSEYLLGITYRLVDIFQNFDSNVVNQFAPSIIDTLNNLLILIDNNYADKQELMTKTYYLIKDIYDTILSFGEEKEYFPTPLEILHLEKEKQRCEQEERKRKEEIARKEYKEKQDDFLEKIQHRRELLKDFNRPINEIPDKFNEMNKEIDKKMSAL